MLPGAPFIGNNLGNNSGWTTSTPPWLQNQPQNRPVGVPTFQTPVFPGLSRPDIARFSVPSLPTSTTSTPFSLPHSGFSTNIAVNPFTGNSLIPVSNTAAPSPFIFPSGSPMGPAFAPTGFRPDAWAPSPRPYDPYDPYEPTPYALPGDFTTTPTSFRPQPDLSETPWQRPAANRPWPPSSQPDNEWNRYRDNENFPPSARPSEEDFRPGRPGASRPRPEKIQEDETPANDLNGPLGPEYDEAAQIANEVQQLVYDGLQANPELVYKMQRLGIVDKLKNRQESALELRAKAQDVLDLIPDRLENRFQDAVGSRLGPTYQPLFDEAMDWIRKPLSPQEARRTGHTQKKSWMVRLWNWLWGDRHIPFLGKKHRKEEDLYF